MVDWAELTLFLYISSRISGFVLFSPIFGRNNITTMFRAGMILVLSVFVASVIGPTEVAVPTGLLELAVRMMLEMSIGFVLGMCMQFFFYIPQLAGEVVDTQMGMTMNQIYDAGAQASLSVSGVMINTLMILVFFAANGHLTLLRILLTSSDIIPYGTVILSSEAMQAMLALFVQCTILAVKLCMPVLAAELVSQLGMGILMKVIPQINVFAINIELKIIIGLGLMFMLIAPFSEYLLRMESQMLESMNTLLGLMG